MVGKAHAGSKPGTVVIHPQDAPVPGIAPLKVRIRIVYLYIVCVVNRALLDMGSCRSKHASMRPHRHARTHYAQAHQHGNTCAKREGGREGGW